MFGIALVGGGRQLDRIALRRRGEPQQIGRRQRPDSTALLEVLERAGDMRWFDAHPRPPQLHKLRLGVGQLEDLLVGKTIFAKHDGPVDINHGFAQVARHATLWRSRRLSGNAYVADGEVFRHQQCTAERAAPFNLAEQAGDLSDVEHYQPDLRVEVAELGDVVGQVVGERTDTLGHNCGSIGTHGQHHFERLSEYGRPPKGDGWIVDQHHFEADPPRCCVAQKCVVAVGRHPGDD